MEKWGRGGIRIGGNHSVGWNGSKKWADAIARAGDRR